MRAVYRLVVSAVWVMSAGGLHAQIPDDGSKAYAERAIQAYLALWSNDGDVNRASVARFYAPHVVYYGKPMSRAEILADKEAYIRRWPIRRYQEVPGTIAAACNADRTICKVAVDMAWRRVGRNNLVSIGRARMMFTFVPIEGNRKIARESARIL